MRSPAFQRRALAGGFAVAAVYLVIAVVEAITHHDALLMIPYGYTALSIAGPLVVVSRLLHDPPPGDEPEGPDDPGGGDDPDPPPGGGDDPESPPWWDEFEQAFRAHVDAPAEGERTRIPA
jgi:hypothetical protein